MKNFKLQSAMEYLMTYGWAILIIAVVMVALFALGVFSGSPLGTQCLPQSGFECVNPTMSAATGNLIVQVGQIGQTFASSNIFFVPTGATPTGSAVYGVADGGVANAINPPLSSGQPVTVWIPVGTRGMTIGSTFSGALWLEYTTSTTGGVPYDKELATVTLKAS